MKTYAKVLAALAAVTVLCLGRSYVLYLQDHPVHCSNTFTISGEISADTFVAARECLVRYKAAKKTFVVEDSTGGDGAAAMALGLLIHRYNWDVEVIGLCASSCASFIFPAGKTKYLHRHSMLLFHGDCYQENLMEMAVKFDQESKMKGAPVKAVILGQENKEGTIRFTPGKTKAGQEVREFLSIADSSSAVEQLTTLRGVCDRYYQELALNPELSAHGQTGSYEPTYKSYKYGGFTYRLDSLRRLGIRDIELKDGEWEPEQNRAYHDVYEVTYP